jgi:hypothetical protein
MSIEGVKNMDLVGIGKKFVFSGEFESTSSKVGAHDRDDDSDSLYIFKVFSRDYCGAFERELNTLQLLVDLP